MIDYNYHTHTYRCGHAFGTEREYIEKCISLGIKVLGFSDHILFEFGDEDQKAKFNSYIETINLLKEEYKDKIEIHLGFECEYLEERRDYFEHLLKDKKVEYLILGQHFAVVKNKPTYFPSYKDLKKEGNLANAYYRAIKSAVKTGLFTYIAHPDFVIKNFTVINKKYLRISRKICKLAKKYNIPLEINLNGLKNHYNHMDQPTWYPNDEFFKIAGEVGNDVIIGIDAHELEFFDRAKYDIAEEMIKKYNLHEIKRLNFK